MSTADKTKLAYIGARPGETGRDSDSWFTPSDVLDRARWYLTRGAGRIDFDPFSSAEANNRLGGVNAEQFFTKEDDATRTPWPVVQSVFMNPPYGRGILPAAVTAFVTNLHAGRFERGIVLVNNATETNWWLELRQSPYIVAVCMPHGRIAFENVDGKRVSGNTRGQGLLFFDSSNRHDAQRRAREAFEGTPDNRGKARFSFMGYVDAVKGGKA